MAYNQSNRFPSSPTSLQRLGPGSYYYEAAKLKPNKVPFHSNTPRNTQAGIRVYTHAIYQADISRNIGNIAAFISKQPRFPYEALSEKDIEDILCRCGIQTVCECTDEPEPEIICQGKVRRRLFKGPPPRSVITEGLSAPSKRDHGFEVNSDGTQKRIFIKEKDQSPPFYNTDIIEMTAFYRGCKWSKWKSSRATKTREQMPGPADYNFERKSTQAEICAEKLKEFKRKTSRQLRFIEMVQQRNILEGRPGPATYSPQYPVGNNFDNVGPKAPRFAESKIEKRPGPADHMIRRDFEPPPPPDIPCHATLPEPSFFGVKAARFKPRYEEGPSPASYSPSLKLCQFVHCPTAGFGSSIERFKDKLSDENDDTEIVAEDEPQRCDDKETKELCPTHTSIFKSKVRRFKPLKKLENEPSPADLPQQSINIERSSKLQIISPFCTSEGRFVPWKNYIPLSGGQQTPGPGYYNLGKPRCTPAVSHGPLSRAQRFPPDSSQNPGPGEYDVINGAIETILETHNQKLKDNIRNQPNKFSWEPPEEPRKLTFDERETLLINKCIALLEVDENYPKLSKAPPVAEVPEVNKPKLLRFFLYSHPMKQV